MAKNNTTIPKRKDLEKEARKAKKLVEEEGEKQQKNYDKLESKKSLLTQKKNPLEFKSLKIKNELSEVSDNIKNQKQKLSQLTNKLSKFKESYIEQTTTLSSQINTLNEDIMTSKNTMKSHGEQSKNHKNQFKLLQSEYKKEKDDEKKNSLLMQMKERQKLLEESSKAFSRAKSSFKEQELNLKESQKNLAKLENLYPSQLKKEENQLYNAGEKINRDLSSLELKREKLESNLDKLNAQMIPLSNKINEITEIQKKTYPEIFQQRTSLSEQNKKSAPSVVTQQQIQFPVIDTKKQQDAFDRLQTLTNSRPKTRSMEHEKEIYESYSKWCIESWRSLAEHHANLGKMYENLSETSKSPKDREFFRELFLQEKINEIFTRGHLDKNIEINKIFTHRRLDEKIVMAEKALARNTSDAYPTPIPQTLPNTPQTLPNTQQTPPNTYNIPNIATSSPPTLPSITTSFQHAVTSPTLSADQFSPNIQQHTRQNPAESPHAEQPITKSAEPPQDTKPDKQFEITDPTLKRLEQSCKDASSKIDHYNRENEQKYYKNRQLVYEIKHNIESKYALHALKEPEFSAKNPLHPTKEELRKYTEDTHSYEKNKEYINTEIKKELNSNKEYAEAESSVADYSTSTKKLYSELNTARNERSTYLHDKISEFQSTYKNFNPDTASKDSTTAAMKAYYKVENLVEYAKENGLEKDLVGGVEKDLRNEYNTMESKIDPIKDKLDIAAKKHAIDSTEIQNQAHLELSAHAQEEPIKAEPTPNTTQVSQPEQTQANSTTNTTQVSPIQPQLATALHQEHSVPKASANPLDPIQGAAQGAQGALIHNGPPAQFIHSGPQGSNDKHLPNSAITKPTTPHHTTTTASGISGP